MYLFRVLVALSTLSFISLERCEEFDTCGQCIGNRFHCAWCSEPKHAGPRCVSGGNSSWCSDEFKYDPDIIKTILPDAEESQFYPSHVTIKARPGDTVPFNVYFKPKDDYPIDVYYLFDNSWSMRDYKKKLCDQAQAIYDGLTRTSNNVRFGAGSFVDKLALPLANELDNQKLNTFNNHLSLTKVISKFVTAVKRVEYTSNLDDREAGLEALMQVMVCEDELDWRPGARRIIILSTDESYHSAGDGKAVGAFKPNDMKCHLKKIEEDDPISTHIYTKEASLDNDYPSVSQINYMAMKKDISIFFVATEKVKREYEALANAIVGAKFVEFKKESNLVNIIVDEYTKLKQQLQISPSDDPPHLHLELDPNCEDNYKTDSRCSLPYGGGVNITARLHVKSCPKGNEYRHTLMIKSTGLSDNTNIDVEVLCRCPCETSGEENSPICGNRTSHGTYQCGVCKCDKGWYGKTCLCEGESTEKESLHKCTKTGANEPCSGKGNCSCGVCQCWTGYDGAYCEYRTDSCPTSHEYNDKVCAGEDHGRCKEGKCDCVDPWEGNDCSCDKRTDRCVGANGKVCSGNGQCKCGSCIKCTNDKYTGNYCDHCDTCNEERCEQLKDYVVCNYDGKNIGDKKECDNKFEVKTNVAVEIKNQTEIEGWTDGVYCRTFLPDESSIVYKYLDGNNSTILWIQKEKEEPPERNIWVPIGSAIGAILLIGLLTLIAWKILVDIHDAREYRKFAAEAEKSGFEVMENPLYKPAAVSINNPAYDKHT